MVSALVDSMTSTDYQPILRAYQSAQHIPNARNVQEAYTALKRELWLQFRQVEHAVDVKFSEVNPYATSGELFAAVNSGHLAVYTLADLPVGHPMLERAPNGETFNSVFRAVHDGAIHAQYRLSFGLQGETRAFREHYRLLSPLAGHAIVTETLAQTAVFRFGPHADLPVADRPFPEQKATLLPVETFQLFTR